MTQNEVDLIYDYLHKRFYYKDGNLIEKKNNEICYGTLCNHAKKLLFMLHFRSNEKRYHWPMSHLIYLFHHKEKPCYIVNVNGNPSDIRIENLKSVNHSEMMLNSDLKVKNKHGYKGVYLDGKRYAARLWINGKYKYISWHEKAEEAHEAYLKAKKELGNK